MLPDSRVRVAGRDASAERVGESSDPKPARDHCGDDARWRQHKDVEREYTEEFTPRYETRICKGW